MAFLRKVEWQNGTEERIGDLNEDACAITGVHLGAGSTAMIHVAKRPQTVTHDLMAPLALHVNDKVDAASVVFESGVVETLCAGEPRRAKR
jgi:hypothetical protein